MSSQYVSSVCIVHYVTRLYFVLLYFFGIVHKEGENRLKIEIETFLYSSDLE